MLKAKSHTVMLPLTLIALLGLIIYARNAPIGNSGTPADNSAHAIASRDLIFLDGSQGSILVLDAGAPTPFAVLKRDDNNFLASTVRLMASERARRTDAGSNSPFRLTLWSDGRLSFADPRSGQTVDITAFGPTNVQSFARLLPSHGRL